MDIQAEDSRLVSVVLHCLVSSWYYIDDSFLTFLVLHVLDSQTALHTLYAPLRLSPELRHLPHPI